MKENKLRVAILGATGVVGREMCRVLEERLPEEIGELRLLASPRSAGSTIRFRGRELSVVAADQGQFDGLDYVLGAVSSGLSRIYAPVIREAGAVYIDNSSAFRLDPEVPLVVPEVNGADALRHRGLVANPNCCTIIALTALQGIHRLSPIRSIRCCSYQAVSGAGAGGIRELEQQLADRAAGREPVCSCFPAPIAGNVIPLIGALDEAGNSEEECKLEREGRRILHRPQLRAACTCVRVPVERSHALALTVETETPLSVEQARRAIALAPGCRLMDAGLAGPTPLQAAGRDPVLVGRVRRDAVDPGCLSLFCCGDQLRKGAAANAVQILETLLRG